MQAYALRNVKRVILNLFSVLRIFTPTWVQQVLEWETRLSGICSLIVGIA
jgi:hypothetical protein